ncbi:YegS/Rv2252/BmrU family lipid kinase [Lentibacillus sp. JNUCC-1]|uniref:YegS/Rv2252/BmrU family lipid kinase n=1 Tax=Lentibacillus sp. JNUCC-1 TaxID=2654513 RepID=UPI002F91407C
MRYNKAVLIYNGVAGGNNLQQKLAQTLPILSQAIRSLNVVQTLSQEETEDVCQNLDSDIELLLILGGDGTVHVCINVLAKLEHRPVIGILPGGTSNDFTRTLGIPQNLQTAAQTIVNGIEKPIDVGVSGTDYFLNFWGVGLVTETSKNIDVSQKQNLGVLSYLLSTIKSIGNANNFTYELETEEETYKGDAVLIFVLNGRFIGTRELPIPTLEADDGMLEVLIVKNSNLGSFREFMAMKNPDMDKSAFQQIEHFRVKDLAIKAKPKQEVDMDGEIYQMTPAEISILPGHFRMIGVSEPL